MSVTLKWHGHACWTVESDDATLLIDPWLSDNPMADVGPEDVSADYILISHGHFDHVGDAVQIAKRTGATIISTFEVVNYCQGQGAENGHGMNIGGGFNFPFGRVQLTIAHHTSMLPDGSYGGDPAGFLITIGGATIYDAADTALFGDMKLYGDMHDIDVALIPIGDNFTMGPRDALQAVKFLRPKVVIPMHYNTFDLIAQDVDAWAEQVKDETESRVAVLKPGESYTI
ncbi:MAG: metal-dependent hydrolase [Chloroflexi bacterium]|nr:MAG: metal-dependent hydrolase [Chloroflexota bacterium]